MNNLFPEINPNLDEIIEMESVLDADEIIKDEKCDDSDDESYEKPKSKHEEVFSQNVKLEIKNKPKRDYSHLKKAREKGAITRKEKAEAKRLLKAEAKAVKEEEKRLRREATKERNRQKARDRYYKQKDLKEDQEKITAEKIITDTKPKHQFTTSIHAKPNNMDFNTFAKYMLKYETMKEDYHNERKAKIVQPPPTKPIEIPYHPPNYPLNYRPRAKTEWNGF
tara:strand:- start:1418 stop:2086 length:669 start_codon:yes stop_codon:yes gene_type:complete